MAQQEDARRAGRAQIDGLDVTWEWFPRHPGDGGMNEEEAQNLKRKIDRSYVGAFESEVIEDTSHPGEYVVHTRSATSEGRDDGQESP